ncbi:hypothetical protein JKP88DRAFT_247594 [Tribonema minus]|uniref:DUF7869 domain-containing protein n=1 Tax=Tribonema minus TaxID=303371 RepID=A0A835YXX5_9STRA|nr:hypothetical protein JKP88DRAFT_247594 [Tribonema minus]
MTAMLPCRQFHAPKAKVAISVHAWLRIYWVTCESQPDSDQVHSPLKRKVWAEWLPQLKVRKTMRFTTCSMCVDYRERLDQTRDPATSAASKTCYYNHIKDADAQRRHYMLAAELAEAQHNQLDRLLAAAEDAGEYTSTVTFVPDILTICMDAAAMENGLPQFHEKNKAVETGHAVRLTLLGAKMHGVKYSVFTVLKHLPGGGNLTSTALNEMLQQYREKNPGRPFPKQLRLQLDNTNKDNKNHTVMAYCALLVLAGLFQTVELHFLLVGHTHCDIDSTFGTVKGFLQGANAISREHLGEAFAAALSTLDVFHMKLDNIANIKDLLKPFIKPVTLITYPQAGLGARSLFDPWATDIPVEQLQEPNVRRSAQQMATVLNDDRYAVGKWVLIMPDMEQEEPCWVGQICEARRVVEPESIPDVDVSHLDQEESQALVTVCWWVPAPLPKVKNAEQAHAAPYFGYDKTLYPATAGGKRWTDPVGIDSIEFTFTPGIDLAEKNKQEPTKIRVPSALLQRLVEKRAIDRANANAAPGAGYA